jgi:hypothetical protein
MTVREFLICSIGLRPPFCVLIPTSPLSRHGKPVHFPRNTLPLPINPSHGARLHCSRVSVVYVYYIYVYCIYWIYEKGTRNLFTPSHPVPFILIKFPRAKTNIYIHEYTTIALQQCTHYILFLGKIDF